MGQTMSTVPPMGVSAVLCGVLHGPCLSYAATQECHTLVKCHTAASTIGSCVLEETAGTEGRHRLPSPHSQKYLLQKTNKQKNLQKTRKAESDKCPPIPGDTRHWSSSHPKDPFKIWLQKDKHEYRTSLAGKDNAVCGETPATHTVQSLWHHG